MDKFETAESLIDFVSEAVTPIHAVSTLQKYLDEAGYTGLNFCDEFAISKGGKYYVSPFDSMLIAFEVGDKFDFNQSFRMIAGHLDSPCFKIKSRPDMSQLGYRKVNVEPYGSMIMGSWYDRPLSVAGQVALKSDNLFKPRMVKVDFKRPILIIPSLAIHQNKEVNKGVEIDAQTDMTPLTSIVNDELNKGRFFMECLADEIGENVEDILDFELFAYVAEQGAVLGMQEDFISAPRLDDLAMSYAAIKALVEAESPVGVNLVVLFDNEEVGSNTKQGANTELLERIMLEIVEGLGYTKSIFDRALTNSYILSADASHALHPNKEEKSDPTNKPLLGNGIIIKQSANQRYLTDCRAAAIFQAICDKAGVPVQRFVDKSGQSGGRTLGPIISKNILVQGIDVGIPMLSMHSAKELIAIKDQIYVEKAFKAYFEYN